jgi:hypothetical protein
MSGRSDRQHRASTRCGRLSMQMFGGFLMRSANRQEAGEPSVLRSDPDARYKLFTPMLHMPSGISVQPDAPRWIRILSTILIKSRACASLTECQEMNP